jgi:hypothetical protein
MSTVQMRDQCFTKTMHKKNAKSAQHAPDAQMKVSAVAAAAEASGNHPRRASA